MSTRKTSIKSILRYAKRLDKLSYRKLDFGEAKTNQTTEMHSKLLEAKRLVNNAINRLMKREKANAQEQFLKVVMYSTFKKTGSKKVDFQAFKKSVDHSNLDQLMKKSDEKENAKGVPNGKPKHGNDQAKHPGNPSGKPNHNQNGHQPSAF